MVLQIQLDSVDSDSSEESAEELELYNQRHSSSTTDLEDLTDLTIDGKLRKKRSVVQGMDGTVRSFLNKSNMSDPICSKNSKTIKENQVPVSKPKFAQSRFLFSDSSIKSLTRPSKKERNIKSGRILKTINDDRRAGSESNLCVSNSYTKTIANRQMSRDVSSMSPFLLNPILEIERSTVPGNVQTSTNNNASNAFLTKFNSHSTTATTNTTNESDQKTLISTINDDLSDRNELVSSQVDLKHDYQNTHIFPTHTIPPLKPPRLSPTTQLKGYSQRAEKDLAILYEAGRNPDSHPMSKDQWLQLQELYRSQHEKLNLMQKQREIQNLEVHLIDTIRQRTESDNCRIVRPPFSVYPSTTSRPKYAEIQDYKSTIPHSAQIIFSNPDASKYSTIEKLSLLENSKCDNRTHAEEKHPNFEGLKREQTLVEKIRINSRKRKNSSNIHKDSVDDLPQEARDIPLNSVTHTNVSINGFQPVISPSESSMMNSISIGSSNNENNNDVNLINTEFLKRPVGIYNTETATTFNHDISDESVVSLANNYPIGSNGINGIVHFSNGGLDDHNIPMAIAERRANLVNGSNENIAYPRLAPEIETPDHSQQLEKAGKYTSHRRFHDKSPVGEVVDSSESSATKCHQTLNAIDSKMAVEQNRSDEYNLGDFMMNPENYSSPDDFRYSLILEKQNNLLFSEVSKQLDEVVNNVKTSDLNRIDCKESVI